MIPSGIAGLAVGAVGWLHTYRIAHWCANPIIGALAARQCTIPTMWHTAFGWAFVGGAILLILGIARAQKGGTP